MQKITLNLDNESRTKITAMAERLGGLSLSACLRMIIRNQYKIFEKQQQVLQDQQLI